MKGLKYLKDFSGRKRGNRYFSTTNGKYFKAYTFTASLRRGHINPLSA